LKCPKCGNVVPGSAKFCAYCGACLQQAPAYKATARVSLERVIGVVLGASTGFGAGVGIAKGIELFILWQGGDEPIGVSDALWLSIIALAIVTPIIGSLTKAGKRIWLIFFFIGIPSIVFAAHFGADLRWVQGKVGAPFQLLFGFKLTHTLLTSIPFTVLGAIMGDYIGDYIGRSISRK